MEQIFQGLNICGKKITSATKFIDFFVHDILDYTILNKNEANFTKDNKVFSAKHAINEISEILEDKTKMKQIKVRTLFVGFENKEFLVKTDQKRFQQVLLNLYSNAVKFTNREGKITIIVQKLGDKVRVSVVDDGLGIKKEDQTKMFSMFGTIKDVNKGINTKGIGLGLLISKLIVEKFNGKINFISKYNKGTTFFFDFEIQAIDMMQKAELLVKSANKLPKQISLM